MGVAEDRKNIVIIGGGIVGSTTAYYLSHHALFSPLARGDTITLLEATKIASGASGKAGGLLASWAYPKNIVELSFDLHAQLAAEHGGAEAWGYRRVKCGELTAVVPPPSDGAPAQEQEGGWSPASILLGKWRRGEGARKKPAVLPEDLDWFSGEAATGYEEIAGEGETAQVHPLQFTQAMARLAAERGVKIVLGKVTDINCVDDVGGQDATVAEARPLRECLDSATHQRVVSVTYVDKESGETRTMGCNTVVLAAGPWTPTLLPGAPISSLRAHSITIRPTEPVSPYCLFTEITLPSPSSQPSTPPAPTTSTGGKNGTATDPSKPRTVSPEIYARPNNEIYVCGRGDTFPLPASTSLVAVSPPAIAELVAAASAISPHMRDGVVTGRRACYLPTVDVGGGGGPLVGQTDVAGLVLAAGHSCWGILNAPGTGLVVAELVMEGEVKCADVGALDPRKIL